MNAPDFIVSSDKPLSGLCKAQGLKRFQDVPELVNHLPYRRISDKTKVHKNFLKTWLPENQISYTLDEIWQIREACIEVLAKKSNSDA